jgi:hypothetical protein
VALKATGKGGYLFYKTTFLLAKGFLAAKSQKRLVFGLFCDPARSHFSGWPSSFNGY